MKMKMKENYKILAEFIKDMSSETPDVKLICLLEKILANIIWL